MPDADALVMGGMGYAPIASGIREPIRYGTEGVPGIDMFGPVSAVALNGPFQHMMQSAGMAPMGVGHDQNIYDIMRARQFQAQQRQAVAMAANFDRRHYMRTMRNMYSAAGIGFGMEQRRTAGAIASLAQAGSPILTQMAPEFLDALGGQVGSAAVMASQVSDAGRYMMDPVTGMTGMTASSVARLTGQMYAGVEANRGRYASAGQQGALFGELERRGMMGSGFMSQQAQYEALQKDHAFGQAGIAAAGKRAGVDTSQKLSGKDLDTLMMDPEVGARLQAIDSSRITKSIEGYTKAISVMRDIFGDSGRPNAPMKELMAGLEALTMGMGSQFDPTQLGNMAQKTYTLSKNAGVNMNALMAIQGNMAAGAARSGLDPSFAIGGTQQSIAANQAFRQMGYGAGGGWHGMDVNRMTQLYGNLYNGAAASEVGNRLSFLNRVGSEIGFDDQSSAAAAFAALKSGQKTFKDPRTGVERSLSSLSGSDLMKMTADGSGMTQGQTLRMLEERNVNKEYTSANVINTTMASQYGDVRNQLLNATTATTLQSAFGSRMDEKAATSMANKVGSGVLGQLQNFRTDIKGFKADLADSIQANVRANGGGAMLDAMDPKERDRFISGLANSVYGANTQAIKNSNFSGFSDLLGLHRMTNPQLANRVGQITDQADADAMMLNSLSGLGRGSLLRRGFDALGDLKDLSSPDAVKKALAKTLGGVSGSDIADSVSQPMAEIATLQREANAINRQMQNAAPAEKKKLQEQYTKLAGQIKEKADAFGSVVEQSGGVFGTGATTPAGLADAARTQRTMHAMTLDTLDLTSGVSAHVADEDARKAAVDYGEMRKNMSDADLTTMVIKQRKIALKNKEYSLDELAAWRVNMPGASSTEIADVIRRHEMENLDNLKLDERALYAARHGTPLANLVGGDPDTNMLEFGREVAKYARSQTSLVVSDEEVAAYRAKIATDNKGKDASKQLRLSDGQLRFNLEMKRRAKRWGIADDEINPRFNTDGTPETDADAIIRVYRGKQEALLGGDDEIQKETDPAKKQALREKYKNNRIKAYVEGRSSAKRFWRPENADAQRVRDAVEAGESQMDDFVNAVGADASEVRGMGSEAITAAKRFKEIKKERQRLADIYTGGDLARLQIGDLTYDAADEGEAKRAAEVKRWVDTSTAEVTTSLDTMRKRKLGQTLSDDDEAANFLGYTTGEVLNDKTKADAVRKQAASVKAFRRLQKDDKLWNKATLAKSLSDQIAATTDPARKKELEDRLKGIEPELGDDWRGALEYDDKMQKDRVALGGAGVEGDFRELLGYHGINEDRASSNPGLTSRLKSQKHKLELWKESAKRLVTHATNRGLQGTDRIGQMQDELEQADKAGAEGIAKFRKDYKIKDDDEYNRLREDISTQRKLRGGAKLVGSEQSRFAALSEGIERQSSPQLNITATLPENMKLTLGGEVKLNREGTAIVPNASTTGQITNSSGGR